MRTLKIESHALKPGSLIRSKLRPPPQASGLLRRERLINLIDADQARITVVQAPSGFGKSTLLAQSFESFRSRGMIAAWLSLDEDDRDPSLFVAALIAAFGAAGVELGSLLTAAEAGLPATRPRSALAALLNPLNSLDTPGILFIDDLHRAQTSEIASLMQTFQSNLDPKLRLVIAGRTRPDLDLAKLAAKGELRHIAAENLRFTADEARHQFGEWDAEQLHNLMRRTDGWPVALQLARIYLVDQEGSHGLERFTGRTPELAGYLAEQVFADLPQVLQNALMAIAFLERINGDLISALCRRTDGWRLLEEIESRNLFISPLDEERKWFHFHKIFSEFLQEQCRK
ncbi:MAG TPA: AAA family ATPase, partial [Steroidobacteraceae bacterium]|nr:AAA family ATPase [Steroidobacteraceae bacterium]